MSDKSHIIEEVQEEEEKKGKVPLQIDSNHPFQMKTFWKKLDDYDFSSKCQENIFNINNIVSFFSKHGKKIII